MSTNIKLISDSELPSNYLKHHSKNPVQRLLIDNFYRNLTDLSKSIDPQTILDVGSGEGFTLTRLRNAGIGKQLTGVDISSQSVELAREQNPAIAFRQGNIYSLDFSEDAFDLVLCNEVLEHLAQPERAVLEILRVTKKYALFSVPNEPYFQISNFIRGKYLSGWGNHPEHIQHWTNKRFRNFLIKYNFAICSIKLPYPWIMILAEKLPKS